MAKFGKFARDAQLAHSRRAVNKDKLHTLKDAGAFDFRKLPTGLSLDTSDSSPADTAVLIGEYLSIDRAELA